MPDVSPEKPRSVLFLVNSLGGGGSERNVAMICKHIDRTRFEPEVWTLFEGGDYEQIVAAAGVTVRCLHRNWAYDPLFALRVARRIARSDAELIHSFLPAIAFNAALARVIWRAKQPLIYYEGMSQHHDNWVGVLRLWAVRQSTNYMANSPASRDCLIAQGAAMTKIKVIPNAHETRQCPPRHLRQVVRERLGVRPDEKLVIYVGRMITDQKRVCDLIEAVAGLDAIKFSLRVVLAGDGPELTGLRRQVHDKGLSRVIQVLGRRRDVPDLLRAADLFVLPSEYEGLSNAVIEAALAGLPIVACDVAGVCDVVKNGRDALLVPPRRPDLLAAAMAQVLQNPEEARIRAASAQKHAEKSYAIQSILPKLCEWYEEILDARPSNDS